MKTSRRSFLAAIAALPLLSRFVPVEAAPEPTPAPGWTMLDYAEWYDAHPPNVLYMDVETARAWDELIAHLD